MGMTRVWSDGQETTKSKNEPVEVRFAQTSQTYESEALEPKKGLEPEEPLLRQVKQRISQHLMCDSLRSWLALEFKRHKIQRRNVNISIHLSASSAEHTLLGSAAGQNAWTCSAIDVTSTTSMTRDAADVEHVSFVSKSFLQSVIDQITSNDSVVESFATRGSKAGQGTSTCSATGATSKTAMAREAADFVRESSQFEDLLQSVIHILPRRIAR